MDKQQTGSIHPRLECQRAGCKESRGTLQTRALTTPHTDANAPDSHKPPSKQPSKLLQLSTLIGIIANLKKRKEAGLKAGNLLAD